MGKPKKSSGSGPRKSHGPKKRMFHFYSKSMRTEMAKLGMLKKDVDKEALEQSITAKSGKVK